MQYAILAMFSSGITVILPLLDYSKILDPFVHQSMMPKLPQKAQANVSGYARFTKGIYLSK